MVGGLPIEWVGAFGYHAVRVGVGVYENSVTEGSL